MLGLGSLWLTRAFVPIAYRSTIPGKIVGVLQAGIAVWIMWQAAHGRAGAASNGPLFAFLALGFVSIVISQAVIGYRHARAGARKRLNGGSPG
jgi:hypothetical protein